MEIGAAETAIYLKHLISGKLDFAVITTPFEMPKSIVCETLLEFEEILVGGLQYKDIYQEPLQVATSGLMLPLIKAIPESASCRKNGNASVKRREAGADSS